MAARGRPSSGMPAEVVGKLADAAGIDLAAGDGEDTEQARRSGLGALLGYVSGLGIATVYGLLRPRVLRGLPVPLAGVALGLAATAATDAPASALGITDPKEWPASSWASDLVPHLVYGLVTAAAFEQLPD